MKLARSASQSRARLDERLAQFGPVVQYRAPARGWIRAIRQALGMTTAQLAKRVGVSQPGLINLEQSEEKGTMQLATLRKVAAALDCHLVYALIPNEPLETTIRGRARALLQRRRTPVEHTMRLENQHVAQSIDERDIDEVIRETSPGRFWD